MECFEVIQDVKVKLTGATAEKMRQVYLLVLYSHVIELGKIVSKGFFGYCRITIYNKIG